MRAETLKIGFSDFKDDACLDEFWQWKSEQPHEYPNNLLQKE